MSDRLYDRACPRMDFSGRRTLRVAVLREGKWAATAASQKERAIGKPRPIKV
uniref:Uncharacterized protein n=1 Tax=Rhizobium rhizogenes TaxID=359 RepID=A0A4P8DK61_RHIRH|nr:hypothetical protein pOC-C5.8_560 [Rhizobium rhizogenes]